MNKILLIISAFWIIYFAGMITIGLAFGQFQTEYMGNQSMTAQELYDRNRQLRNETLTDTQTDFTECVLLESNRDCFDLLPPQ